MYLVRQTQIQKIAFVQTLLGARSVEAHLLPGRHLDPETTRKDLKQAGRNDSLPLRLTVHSSTGLSPHCEASSVTPPTKVIQPAPAGATCMHVSGVPPPSANPGRPSLAGLFVLQHQDGRKPTVVILANFHDSSPLAAHCPVQFSKGCYW